MVAIFAIHISFKQSGIPILEFFQFGEDTDVSFMFYKVVGPIIIQTALLLMYSNLFVYAKNYAMSFFDICWGKSTKKRVHTIQTYVNLHQPISFSLYYHFADLQSTLVICMVFGPLFPVIFVVAALVILVNLLVNKYLLSYHCREPPNYNENLPTQVLEILSYFPILMLLVSFWQLGNPKIFENEPKAVHTFSQQINDIKFTSPYFLPAFLCSIYCLVRVW